LRLIRGRGADLCDDALGQRDDEQHCKPEEGDERKLAGAKELWGGGDNDGHVVGVGGERRARHLQRIGGFIGSNRTCSEPLLLTTTTTTDLTQTTIVEGLPSLKR
jgi:hypothetical protein